MITGFSKNKKNMIFFENVQFDWHPHDKIYIKVLQERWFSPKALSVLGNFICPICLSVCCPQCQIYQWTCQYHSRQLIAISIAFWMRLQMGSHFLLMLWPWQNATLRMHMGHNSNWYCIWEYCIKYSSLIGKYYQMCLLTITMFCA